MPSKDHINILIISMFLTATVGCATINPPALKQSPPSASTDWKLVDSILQVGLDREALYTILGNIKPMSSLVTFSFPIANADSSAQLSADIVDSAEDRVYLDSLMKIQRALNSIEIPDLKFVLSPYKSTYSEKRLIQINVIRISSLDSLLKAEERFFGQFGFVPGADPAIVVNTNEYENKYERLRGYGYLFGYPSYAVDFFVQAFHHTDTSGHRAERNFFQIPVHIRDNGSFVYAYPKDHVPTAEIDSAIYHRAEKVLADYRSIRNDYLNADSTLQSYKLIRDFYKLPQDRRK